jgi:hypothetical protein
MARNEFDEFCRFAFTFLESQGTRYLVIGGLAVVAIGEPRTTADADAIVFVSPAEAESLIRRAGGTGRQSRTPMRSMRSFMSSHTSRFAAGFRSR